jgi:hypothetical protein
MSRARIYSSIHTTIAHHSKVSLEVIFGFSYVSFYHLKPVVITRSKDWTPEFDMGFASRRGTFSETRIGARIGAETSKRGDPIFTPPLWNIVDNGFEWLLLTSPVLETKQSLNWSIPRRMKRKQQASTLFLHVKWTWSLPADGWVLSLQLVELKWKFALATYLRICICLGPKFIGGEDTVCGPSSPRANLNTK